MDDILSMADDIQFIKEEVFGDKEPRFDILSRRLFKTHLHYYEKELGGDYRNLMGEYVHQAYNCAFEEALWFKNHGKLSDYWK